MQAPGTIEQQFKETWDKLQIRIDTDTNEACVGEIKWKIKEDANVDPIRMQIVDIQDTFRTEYKKLENEFITGITTKRKLIEYAEQINKKLLEISLLGFNYENAAKNPACGPVALDHLTKELCNFLVEQGGQVGMRHSQMLSKLALLATSAGTQMQTKSTEVSSSTPT